MCIHKFDEAHMGREQAQAYLYLPRRLTEVGQQTIVNIVNEHCKTATWLEDSLAWISIRVRNKLMQIYIHPVQNQYDFHEFRIFYLNCGRGVLRSKWKLDTIHCISPDKSKIAYVLETVLVAIERKEFAADKSIVSQLLGRQDRKGVRIMQATLTKGIIGDHVTEALIQICLQQPIRIRKSLPKREGDNNNRWTGHYRENGSGH